MPAIDELTVTVDVDEGVSGHAAEAQASLELIEGEVEQLRNNPVIESVSVKVDADVKDASELVRSGLVSVSVGDNE